MTQEQFNALDPKVASHREELLRSQQGELNAVLMYQRLAKVVKTDKEREAFLQLAKEEGRHASVFHAYTKQALKPKKTMALIMHVGVGAVSGSCFFKEDVHYLIRFHFAKRDETLQAALDRLSELDSKAKTYQCTEVNKI